MGGKRGGGRRERNLLVGMEFKSRNNSVRWLRGISISDTDKRDSARFKSLLLCASLLCGEKVK